MRPSVAVVVPSRGPRGLPPPRGRHRVGALRLAPQRQLAPRGGPPGHRRPRRVRVATGCRARTSTARSASGPTSSWWRSAGRATGTATRPWRRCFPDPERRVLVAAARWRGRRQLRAVLPAARRPEARSSAMAHPKATSRSSRLRFKPANSAATLVGGDLHLGAAQVERTGGRAVAGEDEGAVVDPTLGAEALGQAPTPGPLLARGLVARAGAPRRPGRRRSCTPRTTPGGCPRGRPRRGRPAGPGGTGRRAGAAWPARP